jgi:hypothetical protein
MSQTDLSAMIKSNAKAPDIAAHLDGIGHSGRLGEIYALTGHEQKQLYACAADSPPLTLDYFVPPGVPDATEVIHYGKNSQPAFREFQKRWCRQPGSSEQLCGYNETGVRRLIGPGYFVARPTDGGGSDERGAVVVDYYMVPEGGVPEGWPAIKPNNRGLQMFIYNKTRDYMRRVSEHVSIGAAYRQEARVMGYFVLCRQPNLPTAKA